MNTDVLQQCSPNYGPLRFFIRPVELFSKNVHTHFEPQLNRITVCWGTPQFRVFILFFSIENTPRLWEKNSEIRARTEVKTVFFFRDHYKFGRKIAKLEIESKRIPPFSLALARRGPKINIRPWARKVWGPLFYSNVDKKMFTVVLHHNMSRKTS